MTKRSDLYPSIPTALGRKIERVAPARTEWSPTETRGIERNTKGQLRTALPEPCFSDGFRVPLSHTDSGAEFALLSSDKAYSSAGNWSIVSSEDGCQLLEITRP